MTMRDELRPIAYWVKKAMRWREALDTRPAPEEIGPAARALLDFRNMTGGGLVDLPAGTWTVNEPLTVGSDIHLRGPGRDLASISTMTGTADPAILGVGGDIQLSNLNFRGFLGSVARLVPRPTGPESVL